MLRRLKRIFSNYWSASLLISLTIVSVLIAVNRHEENKLLVEKAIQKSAQNITKQLVDQITLYQYGLRGARGAIIVAGDNLTQNLFANYSRTRNIKNEFPGARGFGYIQRVPDDQLAAFVTQVRAIRHSDFTVKQLTEHHGDHYIIRYIEPEGPNLQAIGLDIASQETRREAAIQSMKTGKVILSGPITLVQATGKPLQSFLILLPIYRDAVTPESESERVSKLIGWSYAALLTEDVLHAINLNSEFHLSLTDITQAQTPVHFYQSPQDTALYEKTITGGLTLFGRHWQYTLAVSPEFITGLHLLSPQRVFLISEIISVLITLLAGSVGILLQQRKRVHTKQASLAAIVESSSDGIISINCAGIIESWNPGAEAILGYKKKETIGQSWLTLAEPIQKEPESYDLLKIINQGQSLSRVQTQRRHKNGEHVILSESAAPLTKPVGEITGASITFRDITQMLQMQDELHALNTSLEEKVRIQTDDLLTTSNQLSTAAKIAGLGIWCWDLATDTIALNDKMVELYTLPEYINKDNIPIKALLDRLHPDDIALIHSNLQNLRDGKIEVLPEFRILQPDGEIRYLKSAGLVQYDINGNPVRITGINQDITKQRRYEMELQSAKNKADLASRSKSMFVANMSHEIRTPMNAILGMLQLIQRTVLSVQQKDYVTKAYTAAKLLLNLLNDILDYSKAETGKLELLMQEFSIEELFSELSAILIGSQGGKSVEIMFELDPEIPNKIIGDKIRLQQILINLSSNAVKFTESGNVTISVSLLEYGSTHSRLRFSIQDTGIGISHEQQSLIFESFTQADSSISRQFGGTGLGLSISKQLVNLMGGHLSLESTLGKGSRFWFDISLSLPTQHPHNQAIADYTRHLRCLVVDDNATSLNILKQYFKQEEWTTQCASSGQEALALMSFRNRKPFDVILLDYVMPNINGLDVARQIRKHFLPDESPVVLIISAFENDVLQSASHHIDGELFDDFLMKPITPGQIKSAIRRALRNKSPTLLTAPLPLNQHEAAQEKRLSGISILLVEDNDFNRQIAFELLAAEGADLDSATDGLEATEKVLSHAKNYQVILMDMQMPKMDGLQATRLIRESRSQTELPIIAMTANVNPSDVQACIDAGMNAHLGKPLSIDNIVSTILQQITPKKIAPPPAVEPSDAHEKALARFGNNPSFYRKMLTQYKNSATRLLTELAQQSKADDLNAVLMTLHTLKGSAANIGADVFFRKVGEIESRLKAKKEGGVSVHTELTDQNIQELDTLLHGNLDVLDKALADLSLTHEEPPTSDKQNNHQEIRVKLNLLSSLLIEKNMKAIDLAEELSAHPWNTPEQTQAMHEIARQANNLEFDAANQQLNSGLFQPNKQH
ncbi:hypothetical protein CWC46_10935 [Prodigiosinella confusarubida]|uniref:histidine kinase n=1 Tax=Serratia sp. (strain ATCC 39006) TaxID=104623 RepID=A0A2I5T6S8_SERS3|nr:CHASE domain-containing protein [Serratia sp. ATCC 39006]AUH00273.1 hypothetical protein CWC46_10935 [Serratia sp. ATCC 39006]AUH04593.1 hypothetical protein Ser39006_010940 [Serratia sp. ATCC 39006]